MVLVPTHKSHVDYLILSWLFYDRGMLPPHIAAGANLDFFPVGPLFRRGGAFFLRRSFKNDPLYPVVFRTYVKRLLREGYNVEFFVEGGRSRTGKVLQPRLGLLTYVVEAVAEPGGARDVHVVPVSVGYERLVEAASYERELSGGEKHAEDVRGLLKASRVLRSRYGRLHVEFGRPFALRAWAAERGLPLGDESPAARGALVRKLAHEVAWELSRNTPVTPISLVATVLLSHPRRGIGRANLLVKVGYLYALAAARGARFTSTIRRHISAAQARLVKAGTDVLAEAPEALVVSPGPDAAPGAAARGAALAAVVDETIGLLTRDKVVATHDYGDGQVVYTIPPQRRLRLDYYRNNVSPLFVAESIVATAALGAAPGEDPAEAARWLSGTLKHEFVFRADVPFDVVYGEAVDQLAGMGLVAWSGRGPGRRASVRDDAAAREALGFLRELLRPFLEAYLAAARGLLAPGAATGEKALAQSAERLYLQGDLSLPEASSAATLRNASTALGSMDADGLRAAADRLARLRGDVQPR